MNKLYKLSNGSLYQLCILVTLFSLLCLFGNFLVTGGLTHDNMRIFSVFKDNLFALNHFGEVAWWNPNMSKNGFPMYYFTILSDSFNSPIFFSFGILVWILGLLKIKIENFHVLFVIYFGLIVAAVYLLSIFLLARQIIKNNVALLYVYIVACFSPAIVFSITDRGLEHSAYALFFLTAWIKFTRKPDKKSFLVMSLGMSILFLTFSHVSLYWNVIFIPMFIGVMFVVNKETNQFRSLYQSVPRRYWLALLALIICCSLPTLITVIQGSDIHRLTSITSDEGSDMLKSTLGGRIYPYESLWPGNPFELLSISTPGVGYRWDDPALASTYRLAGIDGKYLRYNYMGFMALPLLVIAILFSPGMWRIRLAVMLVLSVSVILVSGYSPLFSTILAWPLPFRAVRHYSDVAFPIGVVNILLIFAGLGFQTFLNGSRSQVIRIAFSVVLLFSFILSHLVLISLKTDFTNSIFYVEYLTLAIIAVTIIANIFLHNKKRNGLIVYILIGVVLVDVSTQAFLFVRKSDRIWHAEKAVKSGKFEYDNTPSGVLANNILGMHGSMPVSNRPSLSIVKPMKNTVRYADEQFTVEHWGCGSKSWRSMAGQYGIIHSGQISYACLLDSSWSDFTLELDANLIGGGVFLRSNYVNNKVSGVLFAVINNQLHWHVVKNDIYGAQLNVLEVKNIGGMRHWQIIVHDGTYAVYLDDSKKPIATFENNEFVTGDIGLFASSTDTKFYSLKLIDDALISSPGSASVISQTFNTLTVGVSADTPSILMWTDANSKYWSATRNGTATPVISMKNDSAKGIEIPQGSSVIKFKFFPGLLPWAYCLAYISILYLLYMLYRASCKTPRLTERECNFLPCRHT